MLVQGRPITQGALAQWTSTLQKTIEHVDASFFEATTAIAFADFAARGVEIAVVEVGLGGRLDSTNVVQPLASAVTNVTREHEDFLGSGLEGIAREKAGIAKADVPFVIGETEASLVAVLRRVAAEAGARVSWLEPHTAYDGQLALRGEHQRRNAAVAAAVLRVLPEPWRPSDAALARGFARATLPGRFECRGRWILDVAHNPTGARVLAETLDRVRPPRPLHVVVGILGDKDWPAMLPFLQARADQVWATTPPSAPEDRRWSLPHVRDRFPGIHVDADLARALERAATSAATVVVTGSFYTVGDAMACLPGFTPFP